METTVGPALRVRWVYLSIMAVFRKLRASQLEEIALLGKEVDGYRLEKKVLGENLGQSWAMRKR